MFTAECGCTTHYSSDDEKGKQMVINAKMEEFSITKKYQLKILIVLIHGSS